MKRMSMSSQDTDVLLDSENFPCLIFGGCWPSFVAPLSWWVTCECDAIFVALKISKWSDRSRPGSYCKKPWQELRSVKTSESNVSRRSVSPVKSQCHNCL